MHLMMCSLLSNSGRFPTHLAAIRDIGYVVNEASQSIVIPRLVPHLIFVADRILRAMKSRHDGGIVALQGITYLFLSIADQIYLQK